MIERAFPSFLGLASSFGFWGALLSYDLLLIRGSLFQWLVFWRGANVFFRGLNFWLFGSLSAFVSFDGPAGNFDRIGRKKSARMRPFQGTPQYHPRIRLYLGEMCNFYWTSFSNNVWLFLVRSPPWSCVGILPIRRLAYSCWSCPLAFHGVSNI